MDRDHLSPLRCLLTGAVGTGLAGALTWLLVTDLLTRRAPGPVPFAASLTTWCEWVLVGCVVWAWLATTAVVVEALLSRSPSAMERPALPGVPSAWRRLVLLACGAALAAGVAVPAQATPGSVLIDSNGGDGGTGAAGIVALGGLPMPERASDPRRSPTQVRLAVAPSAVGATQDRTVVVRPGDTLWAIARADLVPTARESDAEVGARWREIYALNRTILGADPDLIVPGQRLTLPASHHP